MASAFLLGLVAAASLVVGALLALRRPPSERALGAVMALGGGVLISSVAYELVGEAYDTAAGAGGVGLGLVAGSLAFFGGDAAIDRMGGEHRKDAGGRQAHGSDLAIVLGTVLDGIPESIVLGVGLLTTTSGSVAMLVAVFLSNLPESMASTVGLRRAGWSTGRLLGMWSGIALASGLAAALGFAALGDASPSLLAFVLAFAGGAVLTMLADTMMPTAYAHEGRATGVVTTLGFGLGFALAVLE